MQAGLGRAEMPPAERSLLLERVGPVGGLQGLAGEIMRGEGQADQDEGLPEHEAERRRGDEEVPG